MATARNHTTGQTHKVKSCRDCSADVVWLKSKSGSFYLADAVRHVASTEDRFGCSQTYLAVQPWRGRHECAAPVDVEHEAQVAAAQADVDQTRQAWDDAMDRSDDLHVAGTPCPEAEAETARTRAAYKAARARLAELG